MNLIIKPFSPKNCTLFQFNCTFNSIKRYVQMGQKVAVNGVHIHYERVGNGEHKLLLLPGSLGSTRTDFSPQLNGLNKDLFTLIAWDPPGYGYSRPPERQWNDYYRNDAKIAAQLMRTIGIEKYSILGWSDGGITGLIMGAHNPTNVQKLVVFGANAYVCEEDRKVMSKIKDLKHWNPKVKEAFIEVYGEELFVRLWTSLVEYYSEVEDICTADLQHIHQKCFVLHGDMDPLIAREHPNYLMNNIKNAKLYRFANGRHNIHQQYSQLFNALVTEFLLE